MKKEDIKELAFFAEGKNSSEELIGAMQTKNTVTIVSYDFFESVIDMLAMDKESYKYNVENNMTKIESGVGYDFIMICAPKQIFEDRVAQKSSFYLERDKVVIICKDPKELYKYLTRDTLSKARKLGIEKVFSIAMDKLSTGDPNVLVGIENHIAELEADILRNVEDDDDFNNEVLHVRRRIIAMKGYYEQLEDVCEEIVENENDIFDDDQLIYFSSVSRKVTRRLSLVLNLREFVSQVREASQAASDLKQNKLMKIFTVVTSIFMPLTLITSWYGMNLQMPEFKYKWSYPIVAGVCLVISIVGLLIFRKKKFLKN